MLGKEVERCYLLVGEDGWSKNKWIKEIKDVVLSSPDDMMNYIEMREKEISLSSLGDNIDTLPFFAEKKLIYIKDSGFFKTGKKEESEKFGDLLKHIPEYIVLIIDEKEIDKRSKLYKDVKAQYTVVECNYPGEESVFALLQDKVKEMKLKVDSSTLRYFLRNMPENMDYILGEFHKLGAYTGQNIVSKEEIDSICIFSLEKRIFELIKVIAIHKASEALKIYHNMIQSKESPIGILVLIGRQYRVILQAKYLSKNGLSQKEIAQELKLPYFAVKELIEQSKGYSFKQLEEILEDCLGADKDIKTGRMESVKRVEILIMACLNQ